MRYISVRDIGGALFAFAEGIESMDIKTLCLGVLTMGDASGYEIKKMFETGPFAYFHHAGFGSIYPALNRLSDEGLVTFTQLTPRGRPDKKVYSLTEAGRVAFREALAKTPAPDKIRSDSLVLLMFAHLLGEDRCRQVYDDYLEGYRRLVDEMLAKDLTGAPPGRQFVHGFGLSIYRAIVQYMDGHRHLLMDSDATQDPSRPLKTGTDR